ncbi:hypothetical protein H5410_017647 [Solanum commersonii]|uniref:Miraculin-like n=1 Tax=Solanum commersonii TaxID=4109 RepID=A0A9J6A120_SOLCO|nr:hypothetical protein H5410_017647 [Solanum commersonii]
MKKTEVSCILLITLIVFIKDSLLSEATFASNPVLDTTGKMIRVGSDYMVVPVRKDLGGDIGLAFIGTQVCPLGIGPRLNNDPGLSINFFPVNSKKDHMITNGGVKGNPGRDTISNWFKIVKYGVGYKFVFCPSVCNYCDVICKNVGVFVQNNGQALLALSNEPLEVRFKKV